MRNVAAKDARAGPGVARPGYAPSKTLLHSTAKPGSVRPGMGPLAPYLGVSTAGLAQPDAVALVYEVLCAKC